jgi:hypothetical protein
MYLETTDWITDTQRAMGGETMQTVLHVARENGWTPIDLIGVLILFIVSRGLSSDLGDWIRRRSAVRLPPSHGTA